MADPAPTPAATPPSPPLTASASVAAPTFDAESRSLADKLQDIKQDEAEERETRLGNMDDAWSQWKGRMGEAFKRETASREDIKPWNAELEQAKHQTNVWEAFGSPGFLVAMLGSAFSAMPMNAALQAGGAAITAINQNNRAELDRAFEAWQQNTELAIKRHAMEHQELEDIYQIASKDMEQGVVRLKEHMLKYDDQRGLALLEAGLLPEYWQAKEAEAKAMSEIPKAQMEVMKNKALIDEVEDLSKKEGYEGPAGRFKAITEAVHKMKEAETVRSWTMNQEIFRLAEQEMEKAKARGETIDEAEAIKRAKANITPDTMSSMRVSAIKDIMSKSGADEPTAEKIYNARKHEESLKELERDEIKKNAETKGISLAQAEREFNDAKKSQVGVLDEDAIRVAVYRLFAGDQSAVQGLGWGNVGSTNRAAVQNMIPKIGADKGWSDEKTGRMLASAKAAFGAEMRGASTLGQREALLTAGIEAAASTIPRVIQTAKNVNPTEFSDINRIIQMGQSRTGNKDVVRFGLAMETMIIEYARSLGTSSATTVDATNHAREVLQNHWSQGQLMAGVDQLMNELKSMRAGVVEGRVKFIESFDYDPEKRSLDIPVYVQSEEESHTLRKGQLYITPDLDMPMMRAE